MRTNALIEICRRLALLIVIASASTTGLAQTPDENWVATWASAQQQRRAVGANSPEADLGLSNRTVRMIVRTSIGGERLRVRLSNEFGSDSLTIGAARVALHLENSEIAPGSDRELLFNGRPFVTVPPGAPMLSDPLEFETPALGYLAISLYILEDSDVPTTHALGLHTTYISPVGDFTAATGWGEATTMNSWYWLAGVEVEADPGAATIVAFGDSITDGATSSLNADRSWPSVLAERLADNTATAGIGVVNLGISGNRLLSDGAGVSALARFDRDVLSQSGVRWVVILEGINDIGAFARGVATGVSEETLIGALRQMIARAHSRNIQAIGGTLTPFEGAGYFSEAGEAMRQAVNNFIRNSGEFDAVIDFDAATRDPDNPRRFLPTYNNGDNLHPNDAGYRAMAEAVDLSIFEAGRTD